MVRQLGGISERTSPPPTRSSPREPPHHHRDSSLTVASTSTVRGEPSPYNDPYAYANVSHQPAYESLPSTPTSPLRSTLAAGEHSTALELATTTKNSWSKRNINMSAEVCHTGSYTTTYIHYSYVESRNATTLSKQQWAAPLPFVRELMEGVRSKTHPKSKVAPVKTDDLVSERVVSLEEASVLSIMYLSCIIGRESILITMSLFISNLDGPLGVRLGFLSRALSVKHR